VKLLAPVPEPRQIRDCNNFEQHMRGARIGMEKLKARLAGKPEPDAKDVNTTIHPVNYKHIVFYISNRLNVSGPDAEIEWPAYTEWLDFEGEIGFFIGKRGRDIPKEKALEHVFGYTIFNDFSARDQQADEMEGRMGPTKGKSFDTSNVVGPWIVTRDEIPDYRAMTATVRINGVERGKGTTAEMIHPYEDIIAYISRSETLHPGELIGTGTLGGCCALETGHWPKDGDVVEIDVDRIGVLRNRVRRKRQ
jgi:2-keto-4-pentenoate hydratase/2-oxohepta-3-ene-1,7-dioic acid hydratase in catechol pathway